MDDKKKTIIIVGGASGGHLFPALTVASELKKAGDVNIVIVLSPRSERLMEHMASFECTYVSLPDIRRSLNIIPFISAIIKSFHMLLFYRPDVVVGFGSSISFPLISVAWIRGIPTVIHEQNATFGLANAVLRHIATKVALSFPPGRTYSRSKYVHTGNLIRHEIIDYSLQERSDKKDEKKKLNILILGGSQGAHFINEITLQMFALLTEEQRSLFAVHHMIGLRDSITDLRERNEELGLEYSLGKFELTIGALYHNADLVISRAGAGCIFEIMAFGLPAILIPYPFARAHQKENADYLKKNDAALVLEQNNLTPELFKETFLLCISDTEYRKKMGVHCKKLAKIDASTQLMHEIMIVS